MTPEALWEQLIDCINVEMAHADCREIDHITAALARAHAEGLEAGLRQAAEIADEAAEIWDNAITERCSCGDGEHGEASCRFCGGSEKARHRLHRIRSLIPAAPEVIK